MKNGGGRGGGREANVFFMTNSEETQKVYICFFPISFDDNCNCLSWKKIELKWAKLCKREADETWTIHTPSARFQHPLTQCAPLWISVTLLQHPATTFLHQQNQELCSGFLVCCHQLSFMPRTAAQNKGSRRLQAALSLRQYSSSQFASTFIKTAISIEICFIYCAPY